jgi:glc operon protein GlcG
LQALQRCFVARVDGNVHLPGIDDIDAVRMIAPARSIDICGEETIMRTILLGAALIATIAGASAQERRPDYGTAVNAVAAKKIAAGVLAECQKNGWNVAVAVVDNHGFLVYFERMDNTQTAGVEIAVGKAKSAAMYRRATRVFVDTINKGGPAVATLPGVFASPGGLPIMADGKVVGGVGVSGVTGDQDEQCAKAGLT